MPGELILDGGDGEGVKDVDQALAVVEEAQLVVALRVAEVLAGRVEQVDELGPAAAASAGRSAPAGAAAEVLAVSRPSRITLRPSSAWSWDALSGKVSSRPACSAVRTRLLRAAYRNLVLPAEVSPNTGTRTSRMAPVPSGSGCSQRLQTAVRCHAVREAMVGMCVPHSQRRVTRPSRLGRTSWCSRAHPGQR